MTTVSSGMHRNFYKCVYSSALSLARCPWFHLHIVLPFTEHTLFPITERRKNLYSNPLSSNISITNAPWWNYALSNTIIESAGISSLSLAAAKSSMKWRYIFLELELRIELQQSEVEIWRSWQQYMIVEWLTFRYSSSKILYSIWLKHRWYCTVLYCNFSDAHMKPSLVRQT